jgi:hypothetical protein
MEALVISIALPPISRLVRWRRPRTMGARPPLAQSPRRYWQVRLPTGPPQLSPTAQLGPGAPGQQA